MSKEDRARTMYGTICQTMDDMDWRYTKKEDDANLYVTTASKGGNCDVIYVNIAVGIKNSSIYVYSPMTFKVPQERRDDVALAITRINWTMLNGCFDMNYADGYLSFKVADFFLDSILGSEVVKYMILVVCSMVDKHIKYILDVIDGRMTIAELEEELKRIK